VPSTDNPEVCGRSRSHSVRSASCARVADRVRPSRAARSALLAGRLVGYPATLPNSDGYPCSGDVFKAALVLLMWPVATLPARLSPL
jgi:hypothetical protein